VPERRAALAPVEERSISLDSATRPAGASASGAPDLSSPWKPTAASAVLDRRARRLRDLRLSVTDRCNFRCGYCMPKEVFGPDYRFLPRSELLSFEELFEVARVFVQLGVTKLRLTGGEPLLRRHLSRLVALLRTLNVEIALTTNGLLLERHADALVAAGLNRVTVSLDALSVDAFQRMSGTSESPAAVLAGIDAARRAGLGVKINCVVQRGVNETEVLPLVRYFRGRQIPLRFIEYMDVGCTNKWQSDDVVPTSELIRRISEQFSLTAIDEAYRGEVARRYAYTDGQGEVGFISSVTQPFCGTCTRARVSARGMLYTCLFSDQGTDLRDLLRTQGTDALTETVTKTWSARADRYSEVRGRESVGGSRVEMSYIGG